MSIGLSVTVPRAAFFSRPFFSIHKRMESKYGLPLGVRSGCGMSAITFPATVYKVQTLIDGGVRVTLDLPEECIPEMAMLAETRKEGIPLVFTARVDDPENRKKAGDDRQRRKR